MEGGAATLGAAYPGRFILGIGISHAPIVERSGQSYKNPLAHMVRYLDGMDAAIEDAPVSAVPVPRVLAALRPRMLELARERGDGAHPYFVPAAHTPRARKALGPDKLLIPEQAVVVQTDATEARRIAAAHMKSYLQLPNYVNNLRHLGYGDGDLADGGSDRLVDAIVAWGDEEAIARRCASTSTEEPTTSCCSPWARSMPPSGSWRHWRRYSPAAVPPGREGAARSVSTVGADEALEWFPAEEPLEVVAELVGGCLELRRSDPRGVGREEHLGVAVEPMPRRKRLRVGHIERGACHRPSSRGRTEASWSTRDPRAMLTRCTPGRTRRRLSALMAWWVASVAGAASTRWSATRAVRVVKQPWQRLREDWVPDGGATPPPSSPWPARYVPRVGRCRRSRRGPSVAPARVLAGW